MKFNYYVSDKIIYIPKEELVKHYEIPYTTLLYYLSKTTIPSVIFGKSALYERKAVMEYLNTKTGKVLDWKQ
jgi:hypothetical protein